MNASAQLIAPAARGEGRSTPQFLASFTLLIFATTWACIALVHHSGRISTLWISNAIVLACLLKRPRRAWLELVGIATLANFVADVLVGDIAFNAVGFSLANTIEVLVVALPLRWLGFDRAFSRSEVLLAFYGLVIAACTVSSGIAAATLLASAGASFWLSFRSWFGADALGLSLLVPFFMCVRYAAFKEMFTFGQRLGTVVLLGAVFGVGYVCYALPSWTPSFLYFPVLILLTFRRGFAGGALGLFIAVAISFALALGHHASASLAAHTASERIAIIQLYYAVIGFTIILTGAALDERRALERGLGLAVRRAEASREEALLAKEVAEKASHAKSSFLANMSHELRTPLNAVLGFSQIIAAEMYGPAGDVRYRDYAGMINSAGTHLLDLIGDILDMSKIEAGKLELHRERLDTAAVVHECAELMAERAAAGGVRLDVAPTGAPVVIDADKRAVKQILLNLLSNAVKFTPKGGTVAVRISDEGACCRIAVIDTGIGMPAGELDRIGSPFVQLSNNSGKHSGTGLGLALVRGLAEMHGGKMRIDSAEGQGTTVTVLLPVNAPAATAQAA
ncbi:MAG TPA: ATP-binding protein [Rhizomicrobium sp.]|nr:ATP-binding protein [Rhizomicrobium sp.]